MLSVRNADLHCTIFKINFTKILSNVLYCAIFLSDDAAVGICGPVANFSLVVPLGAFGTFHHVCAAVLVALDKSRASHWVAVESVTFTLASGFEILGMLSLNGQITMQSYK